jgi:antitoxin VapB
MALQIANPTVVDKVEPLERLAGLLSQLDRIPDRPDAADPLPWDEQGLPV